MNFDFSWEDLSKNLQANAGVSKKWERDTRFWKLSKNENGDGAAIIRLLPDAPGADGKPFVKMFHYSIKKYNAVNPKKPLWFIANSPESINMDCPVKDHYLKLMAEGTTEAEKEAKIYKRQTKFIANIMVVKDPANPENDGKVFLWEFGTKMKDKILAWLKPSDEEISMGEEAKALFNPLNGNNIKLKIKKQGEFFTYDGSEVNSTTTSLFADKETAVKFIDSSTYKLSEFLQPEFYESYEVLSERFNKFLSGKVSEDKETKAEAKTETKAEVVKKTSEVDTSNTSNASNEEDEDKWLEDL